MPYLAHKRSAHDRAALAARIPGWGADLDVRDRPAVPKERFAPDETGAHWDFPDRQQPREPREKSLEHAMLTPVFGTTCPPRGLSGMLRRLAYARWSEGQLRHWLLLVLADRIDVAESLARDALHGRPDNFLAEWGIKAELRRHGARSRLGTRRNDRKRLPVDLLFMAAPWMLLGGAGLAIARALRGRGASPQVRALAPASTPTP